MAANAQIGLRVDLSSWRKGIRNAASIVKKGLGDKVMSPFSRGVSRSIKGIRSLFIGFSASVGAALSSALAPLLAIIAAAASVGAIVSVIRDSVSAYRDLDKSSKSLEASLSTLGDIDLSATMASVRSLGEQLRLALGITQTETNNAFGTFVTRGFDPAQARQLTILAANYAKQAGKPIEDVTKMVADAANGSVDAIKELGIEIYATGDRVKDAEAAVLALQESYGSIGSEITTPTERLSAAWNQIATLLGEKIAPILDPIVQGFSDFVSGLAETEKGKALLTDIADTIEGIVSWIGRAILNVSNFVNMVLTGGGVVRKFIESTISKLLAWLFEKLRSLPGGDWILEQMGFDPESASQAFSEVAAEQNAALQKSVGDFSRAQNAFLDGDIREDSVIGRAKAVMDDAARAREDATAKLNAEQAANRGNTFAGNAAQAQAEAERQKQREANNTRLQAQADAQAGQSVQLKIVSRRPDRYRKVRSR